MSRRFVARTAKQVQQYLAQPLNEVDLPVLVIDGTHMGKHLLVDRHGHRRGRRQACAGCRRGHHGELPRVPVAAAAVDRARCRFGEWALIQRCRVHKIKNTSATWPWFAAKPQGVEGGDGHGSDQAARGQGAGDRSQRPRSEKECKRHRHSAPSSGAAASDGDREHQTRQPQRKAVALREHEFDGRLLHSSMRASSGGFVATRHRQARCRPSTFPLSCHRLR